MPAPSKLSIATSAVLRLLREESAYHQELEQREARIKKLEQSEGDENKDFNVKQETQGLEQTKAMFPALRQRIMASTAQLEEQMSATDQSQDSEEVTNARVALAQAKNIK